MLQGVPLNNTQEGKEKLCVLTCHIPEDWTQKVKAYVNVENVIAFISHVDMLCLWNRTFVLRPLGLRSHN